jgi:hypothetical protein
VKFILDISGAWEQVQIFNWLEMVLGTWELLVGDGFSIGWGWFWERRVLGTLEFFGSFNIKEMRTWKHLSKIVSFFQLEQEGFGNLGAFWKL